MKPAARLDYAYAVGRVRALEKNLIARPVFREAAAEPDFRLAMEVLQGAGAFAGDLGEVRDAAGLEAFLSQEWAALDRELAELLPDLPVLEAVRLEDRPEEALAAVAPLGYDLIADYLRHKIDAGNIKALARARYLEAGPERLAAALRPGGFLPLDLFTNGLAAAPDALAAHLRATPFDALWETGLDALRERDTFVVLERGLESFLVDRLRPARFVVFGPEPVFAYGVAKRRELRLIRLVGIGRLNAVPAGLLNDRIGAVYA